VKNKQKIIIVSLALSLFIVVQYFVIEKILDANQEKMSEIYQKGYDHGLKDTITTLYQETTDCKMTTIWLGNLSKQISDATCLKNLSP
jgi:hypothetical protein